MGFRFRKSKKIGPFRINLSSKGIGWSVGNKYFRYTQKAGGGSRTTTTIPGTGISFVQDHGSGKRSYTRSNSHKMPDKVRATSAGPLVPDNPPPTSPGQNRNGTPSGCLSFLAKCFQWFICGFLLLSAVVYFISLTSIFCLVSGLLIMPVKRWQQWLKRYLPIPIVVRYLIAAVLFVLAVAFYSNPVTAPAATASTPTPTPVVEETVSVTPTPRPAVTTEPTATPTVQPTVTPSPTPVPTPVVTPMPTPDPTSVPTPVITEPPVAAAAIPDQSVSTGAGDTSAPAVQPEAPAAVTEPSGQGETVYIASSGNGDRYHSGPTCGRMKNSTPISRSDAEARGYTPCEKCYG